MDGRFWERCRTSAYELMKQRSKLDRLEELTKQLENRSLDSGATADIIEALEELKADYRVRLDVDECEKAVRAPRALRALIKRPDFERWK